VLLAVVRRVLSLRRVLAQLDAAWQEERLVVQQAA